MTEQPAAIDKGFETSLVSVLPEDYEALAIFLSEFEGETRDGAFWLKRLHFWWDDNPAFREGVERGWLLRARGGNIVGFYGNIPTFFRLAGRDSIAYNGTTWRVTPAFRNQSLRLFSKFMQYAKDSIFFSTTPRDEFGPLFKAYRFQQANRSRQHYSFVIVDFQKVIKMKFGEGVLGKILRVILSPLSEFIQSFRLKSLKDQTRITVKFLEKADSKFDCLWEDTKLAWENTNSRHAEAINWFCFGSEAYEKKLFGCYEDNQLLGYAIFWGKTVEPLRELECVDLWLRDKNKEEVLRSLIQQVWHYAEKHYFDLVVMPHFTESLGFMLERMGLWKKRFRKRELYFKCSELVSRDRLLDQAYFVGHQGDYGL